MSRTTIVGSQLDKQASELPPVPTGIQTLLRLAALDAAFLDELVERRADMARAAGVPLTLTEANILAAIPETQLREFARTMPPPPPRRREFLRQAAAAAVLALGGAGIAEALSGCCDSTDRFGDRTVTLGATSDLPDNIDDIRTAGISPDMPPDPPPADDDDSADEPPAEDEPVPPPPPAVQGTRPDMP